MAQALDQFLNFERNLAATINSPHFYDYKKKLVTNGASYSPGAKGTIGIIILYPVSNIALQDPVTGVVSAVLVGNLTLTPRGSSDQYKDVTGGAALIVNIWGHTAPYFIPGDFENIVSSSDYIRYMVIERELRDYEE